MSAREITEARRRQGRQVAQGRLRQADSAPSIHPVIPSVAIAAEPHEQLGEQRWMRADDPDSTRPYGEAEAES